MELPNDPEAFEARFDYLKFKAEIQVGKSIINPLDSIHKRILKILKIEDIDSKVVKRTYDELVFQDEVNLVDFKVCYDKKKDITLAVEFKGAFFSRGKTVQDKYDEAITMAKIINREMNIELVCTRLDVCRDVFGNIKNFFPDDLDDIYFNFQCKMGRPFKNQKTKELETVYLRNIGENKIWEICIYNKSIEILKKKSGKNDSYKLLFGDKDITRFEVRLLGDGAKKYTKYLYTAKDQDELASKILSNFSEKKRAYTEATEAMIKNRNMSRAKELDIWKLAFSPKKTLSLKNHYFVKKSGDNKSSALKRLEKLFITADCEFTAEEVIKLFRDKEEHLKGRRIERKGRLAEQEALFSQILKTSPLSVFDEP